MFFGGGFQSGILPDCVLLMICHFDNELLSTITVFKLSTAVKKGVISESTHKDIFVTPSNTVKLIFE